MSGCCRCVGEGQGGNTKGRELIAAFLLFGLGRSKLRAAMPVSVGTIADGDEAGNEDGGSGSECYECEVHSVSPLARATGQAGIAALY